MFQKLVRWIQKKRNQYTQLPKQIEDHDTYMIETVERQVDLMYMKITGDLEVRSKSLIPLENTEESLETYHTMWSDEMYIISLLNTYVELLDRFYHELHKDDFICLQYSHPLDDAYTKRIQAIDDAHTRRVEKCTNLLKEVPTLVDKLKASTCILDLVDILYDMPDKQANLMPILYINLSKDLTELANFHWDPTLENGTYFEGSAGNPILTADDGFKITVIQHRANLFIDEFVDSTGTV